MTLDEVREVLKPNFVFAMPPARGIDGLPFPKLPADPKLCQIVVLEYSETSVFPPFCTTVTFVEGRLAVKELQKPTFHQILAYWWSRVRRL